MSLAAVDASLDRELEIAFESSQLLVGDIISSSLLECPPETPLATAAGLMHEARCSSILVVDGDEAVGIWTERNALSVDFSDPAAFLHPVSAVMSAPVLTIGVDATLREVVARFRADRVRHYLVVDRAGRRRGVISQTDVVMNHGIEHYLHLRQVKSVVRRAPVLIDEAAGLCDAAEAMRTRGVDAVVVRYAAGGHGIVTERDLVRFIAAHRTRERVGGLASRPVIAVGRDSSLYSARRVLLESHVRHVGVLGDGGELVGLISFFDIITGIEHAYVEELKSALGDRDRALTASRRSLHLAEKVIESSLEGILITDPDGIILSVNPAFTRMTGYSPAEVLGRTPAVLSSGRHDQAFYARMWNQLKGHGYWQGEVWNRRKNGEMFPELLTITAILNEEGELTHYAALFNDISELKENEERIRHLAYYDPLTGLPNRRLLNDRLRVALAHAHRNRTRLAVLFVDLDRFKRINDSLGHSVGDELLRAVSRRLTRCVREDDTVARMGGDEFIVVLSEIENPDAAAVAARRILEELKAPLDVQDKELVVTCSIGISVYPEDGHSCETLVQNADTAMYRAKDSGRNGYQLYTPTMNARSLEHLALETGLRRALDRGELRVFYQPVVTAGGRRTIGVEALLRWQHPELGLVPPGDFIPLAEESGLIIPMGEWVLRAACDQLRAWRAAGASDIDLSVNISVLQFRERGFVPMVRRLVEEEGLAPGTLVLELTESMLMEHAAENVRRLSELREMGVGIAMDDFGTGYSSLAYLKRFSIDRLKIDRSFVRDIERSAEDSAIISAVITLAHSLGLTVVAEGVEQPGQAQLLAQHGCDLLQGFLFGRPVPPGEIVL